MFGKLEVWSGTISGAQASSSVSYSGGSDYGRNKPGTVSINFGGGNRYGRRGGTASTTHHVNLLLDERPVVFSSSQPAALRDGDRAVIGGTLSGNILKGSVYKNVTNGAAGGGSATLLMILGVIFVLVGLPFSLLLIGIPFVIIGGVLIWLSTRHSSLKKMVEAEAARMGSAAPGAAVEPQAAPIVS